MKIVRPICCGLDVHKNVIVAMIGITKDWLLSHNCFDVCMESTGKDWIPVFNILEDDFHIFLTHSKYVKAIKGKKTDMKDS